MTPEDRSREIVNDALFKDHLVAVIINMYSTDRETALLALGRWVERHRMPFKTKRGRFDVGLDGQCLKVYSPNSLVVFPEVSNIVCIKEIDEVEKITAKE